MGPTPRHSARRWLALAAAAATIAGPALVASPATALARGTTWAAARPGGTSRAVIVQAKAGHEAAVAKAVAAAGGTVEVALPIINGFSAHVPAGALAALRARPDVRAVSDNASVRFASNGYESGVTASNYAKTSGATQAWAQSNYGEGVGVAVIDTGISPMNDFAGRLVHGPDLSGEGTIIDTFGHGTAMGGIVGGSGADSASNPDGAYNGVAPRSTLVAVKVAGRNGATDVSTMLQAMHWVSAYRTQFNIRVLNLSWGTNATSDPATDPLNYAVERLWRDGIVVVVSAGNSGPENGTITKPGDDPVVLTVGAYNDKGNLDPADDGIPAWSSRGPTAQGVVKPDVVAPGRTLITTRSYGSDVEKNNPKALIAPSYVKGSGTSEAAAVVSGLAALLVKAHPAWTPDQVKAAIKSTASDMGLGKNRQGAGRVQLAAALAAEPGPSKQKIKATGLGPIEGSRGTAHVVALCGPDQTVTEITGEMDVYCNPWDGAAWSGAAWSGAAWSGAAWSGAAWSGSSWGGAAWSGAAWSGAAWSGGTWTGSSWGGSSWGGAAWSGAAWSGAAWSGAAWSGSSWGGNAWSSTAYGENDFLSAFWGGRPKYGETVTGELSEARQAADGMDVQE
ncbi:MAG: serine protease AprX [Frankiaceae bacterium]|jgi:serine protease AprX|nr:serine protease AprX [Frankiaceae bacterium]